jgi:hypothetical protein
MPIHLLQGDCGCRVLLVQADEDPHLQPIKGTARGLRHEPRCLLQPSMQTAGAGRWRSRAAAPCTGCGCCQRRPSCLGARPAASTHLEQRVEEDGHRGHKDLQGLILRGGRARARKGVSGAELAVPCRRTGPGQGISERKPAMRIPRLAPRLCPGPTSASSP